MRLFRDLLFSFFLGYYPNSIKISNKRKKTQNAITQQWSNSFTRGKAIMHWLFEYFAVQTLHNSIKINFTTQRFLGRIYDHLINGNHRNFPPTKVESLRPLFTMFCEGILSIFIYSLENKSKQETKDKGRFFFSSGSIEFKWSKMRTITGENNGENDINFNSEVNNHIYFLPRYIYTCWTIKLYSCRSSR